MAPYVPSAKTPHAGGQLLHRYLEEVRQWATVTLVAPETPANRDAAARLDGDILARLVPVSDLFPKLRRLLFYPADVVAGLTPGRDLLRSLVRSPILEDAVAGADVVDVHWAQMLPLIPAIRGLAPGIPVSVFLYDVMTQSFDRRARSSSSLRIRLVSRIRLYRTRRIEARLINLADVAFVLSEKDRSLLQSLGVHVPLHVVDPPLLMPIDADGPAAEPVALFVGAFDRPENAEGALWLLQQVWPIVRASVPDASLRIVGAAPPGRLKRVAAGSGGVDVTGYVADLETEYRSARVVLAPLHTGAGVKLKVLDAMARRLPVVTTPVAVEGIADRVGPDVFEAITNDAVPFAEAAIRCLVDVDHARRRGDIVHDAWRAAYPPGDLGLVRRILEGLLNDPPRE